jgi:predicted RNA binding protein YcfA (HicA-like mRNA interferase family)
MASLRKTLDVILSGRSDHNVRFAELCRVLRAMGFQSRTTGGHYIFSHAGISEIINVQALPGGKAKGYQVKQIRQIVTKYGLSIG